MPDNFFEDIVSDTFVRVVSTNNIYRMCQIVRVAKAKQSYEISIQLPAKNSKAQVVSQPKQMKREHF